MHSDLREEGRQVVINFNGFSAEWNETREMENEETTVQKKIAYLVKLFAKKKMKVDI